MNYRIFGPYEIPREGGEFKRRIDKEDITAFWAGVEPNLENACGCYIFSIKTKSSEKPWYVGKAKNQNFAQECFTSHKIVHYHDALEKRNGIPQMYFVVRYTSSGRVSKPSEAASGHKELDFVEQMFIEMGYQQNRDIRNKKGTSNPENLVIEGFYNHKDRRKSSAKKLVALFGA